MFAHPKKRGHKTIFITTVLYHSKSSLKIVLCPRFFSQSASTEIRIISPYLHYPAHDDT